MNPGQHGAVAVGVMLSVSASLVLAVCSLRSDPIPLDPETQCPLNAGPSRLDILMLDISDRWDPHQGQMIRAKVLSTAASLPEGTLLEVFLVPAQIPTVPKPLFRRCAPNNGASNDNLQHGHIWLRRRFVQEFIAPLRDMLTQLGDDHQTAQTPLLEELRGISALPEFRSQSGAIRVAIYSDIVQHSAALNMYRTTPAVSAFERTRHGAAVLPALRSAHVSIDLVANPRTLNLEGLPQVQWWTRYLLDAGASDVEVNPL